MTDLSHLHGMLLGRAVGMRVAGGGRNAAGDVAGVAGTGGAEEAPAGEKRADGIEEWAVAAFAEKGRHEGEAAANDADAEFHGTVKMESKLFELLFRGCWDEGWTRRGMNGTLW